MVYDVACVVVFVVCVWFTRVWCMYVCDVCLTVVCVWPVSGVGVVFVAWVYFTYL